MSMRESNELYSIIWQYIELSSLSNVEAIGILELIKSELINGTIQQFDSEDDSMN
jgi:predicted XRE-type DNA-binding protein